MALSGGEIVGATARTEATLRASPKNCNHMWLRPGRRNAKGKRGVSYMDFASWIIEEYLWCCNSCDSGRWTDNFVSGFSPYNRWKLVTKSRLIISTRTTGKWAGVGHSYRPHSVSSVNRSRLLQLGDTCGVSVRKRQLSRNTGQVSARPQQGCGDWDARRSADEASQGEATNARLRWFTGSNLRVTSFCFHGFVFCGVYFSFCF